MGNQTLTVPVKDETKIIKVEIKDDADLENWIDGAPLAVEGVDDLDRDDLSFPRLSLTQMQSTLPEADSHYGQWHNSMTGEFKKTITAVLLAVAKGRVAFPRDFSRQSDPLCGSDNAIQPRDEYIGLLVEDTKTGDVAHIPTQCADCIFSRFGNNGETPLCAKTYNFFMLDVENGLPIILQLQRTGTKTARQINTIAKMQGRKNLLTLTSNKINSESGSYYEPVLAIGAPTPKEILKQCYQVTQEFGNVASRVRNDVRQNEMENGNGHSSGPDGDAGGVDEHDPERDLPF